MGRLIYDVGMHNGSDTEFYLRKGFDVIAVEANPEYVSRARQKFDAEIRAGRLIIYDVALTETAGEISFFVHEHDDWSRLNLSHDDRFSPGTYREIKVQGLPFSAIVSQHQAPYYVKLDIEGPERMVIEQMFSVAKNPPYLSFEFNSDTDEILDLVMQHGYHDFQLLAQRDKSGIRLPRPPREGKFHDARFDGYMSGPFGLELPGSWVTVSELRAAIDAHHRKVGRGSDEDAFKEWFDIHTRQRDGAGRGVFSALSGTLRRIGSRIRGG
jgi:FkbM family methyltransferase